MTKLYVFIAAIGVWVLLLILLRHWLTPWFLTWIIGLSVVLFLYFQLIPDRR